MVDVFHPDAVDRAAGTVPPGRPHLTEVVAMPYGARRHVALRAALRLDTDDLAAVHHGPVVAVVTRYPARAQRVARQVAAQLPTWTVERTERRDGVAVYARPADTDSGDAAASDDPKAAA